MRLALIFLAACGTAPAVEPPRALPPNTEAACDRAIKCGIFLPEQKPECIACVKTVADEWNRQAKEQWGDPPPPIESVPCDVFTGEAHRTRLSECVVGRWYGP